jgi:hypothetical protein
MALGSPALVTFSLSLTILNRFSIRERFQQLKRRAEQSHDVHDRYQRFEDHIKNIQFLLQEAQQDPIRCSEERHWLSSLIVLPENRAWWAKLKKRLENTRRGVTFSLVAQIIMAGIAWLLTVISSFLESSGDTDTFVQMSSGSIWIWMVSS